MDHGADVAFDTSGSMFPQCVEMAAQHGRIPVITAPRDGKADFNLRNLYRHELTVFGLDTRPMDVTACANILAEIRPGFESGQFKSRRPKPMPLAQAPEAYEQAAGGGGAVVLIP